MTIILISIIICQSIAIIYFYKKFLELKDKLKNVIQYNSINDLSLEDQKEYLQLLELLKDNKIVSVNNTTFMFYQGRFTCSNRQDISLDYFQEAFYKSKEKSDNSLDIDLEIKKMKNRVDLYNKVLDEIKEKS